MPLLPNEIFNLVYGQWFFRFCVPVFFISSGYFFEGMKDRSKIFYIKRILYLYFISEILYSPFIIKEYFEGSISAFWIIKVVILGYGHLWYLAALLYSLVIWQIIRKIKLKLKNGTLTFLVTVLLFIGAFFDEYYRFMNNPTIYSIGKVIDKMGSTRSAVFMGLPLALIGRSIYLHKGYHTLSKRYLWVGIAISSALSLLEFEIIVSHNSIGYIPTCDLTFFNWVPAVFLFIIGLNTTNNISKEKLRTLRKTDDGVYIIHPFIRNVIGYISDTTMYLTRFGIVLVISITISFFFLKLKQIIKS